MKVVNFCALRCTSWSECLFLSNGINIVDLNLIADVNGLYILNRDRQVNILIKLHL